jgi:hypothetical protein
MQPTLAALLLNAEKTARETQSRHRHLPQRKRRSRRWF